MTRKTKTSTSGTGSEKPHTSEPDRPKALLSNKMQGMMLLPAAPGTCPECAVKHEPGMMHNKDSLYYQMDFYRRNGRWPAWKDAMAHCDPEVQKVLKGLLIEKGAWSIPEEEFKKLPGEEQLAQKLMDAETHSEKQLVRPNSDGTIGSVTHHKLRERKEPKRGSGKRRGRASKGR